MDYLDLNIYYINLLGDLAFLAYHSAPWDLYVLSGPLFPEDLERLVPLGLLLVPDHLPILLLQAIKHSYTTDKIVYYLRAGILFYILMM